MSKLTTDEQILNWLRKKGTIIIEGNKEYYVIIDYVKNKFIYRFGDTTTNEDTEVKEMNEIETLEYIKGYFVRRAQVLQSLKLNNTDEVWNFIQKYPYL